MNEFEIYKEWCKKFDLKPGQAKSLITYMQRKNFETRNIMEAI